MSERRQRQDIRIFLSSPGDMAEERRLARELIDGALQKDPAYRDRLSIRCVAWDDPEAPIPLLANTSAGEHQDSDARILKSPSPPRVPSVRDFLRVCVIAPAGAAGRADFVRVAGPLHEHRLVTSICGA